MQSYLPTLLLLLLPLAFSQHTPILPGLDAHQSYYSRIIYSLAPSQRACEVAIATAIQESRIQVLANTRTPESYNYPHDGEGSDQDSVGIFQQRPLWWGTVKDCMDPEKSTQMFFDALKKVGGWEKMELTVAAQSVQGSEWPDRYATHEDIAKGVCEAIRSEGKGWTK